jgi:hypothetical protein
VLPTGLQKYNAAGVGQEKSLKSVLASTSLTFKIVQNLRFVTEGACCPDGLADKYLAFTPFYVDGQKNVHQRSSMCQ